METNSLWESYRVSRDAGTRNRLLVAYAPLVKRVVKTLPFTFMGFADENDMIGEGIFGLIDAIDKYDVRKNVKFETYASLRIRGAILDKLRKMDLLSRNTRDRVRLIEDVSDELEKRLGRTPSEAEIAAAAGITEKAVRRTIEEAALSNMVSLEEVIQNGGALLADAGGENAPEEAYRRREIREALARAVGELQENEKKVVSLYYYEELTLREIGVVMGVSESRVSQILSKSLSKLRKKIAGEN